MYAAYSNKSTLQIQASDMTYHIHSILHATLCWLMQSPKNKRVADGQQHLSSQTMDSALIQFYDLLFYDCAVPLLRYHICPPICICIYVMCGIRPKEMIKSAV